MDLWGNNYLLTTVSLEPRPDTYPWSTALKNLYYRPDARLRGTSAAPVMGETRCGKYKTEDL